MKDLSLRFRVFLFFCLMGIGGIAIVLVGLWLGFRQLGDPEAMSAFVTVATVSAFGLIALAAFVWLLFDENVSKPIEALAAQFRVRADADIDTAFDAQTARYLGDLAPAAKAIHQRLGHAAKVTAETVAQKTARLERQRAQLLRILSDVPIAVVVATQDHQIVLYDGQAAELMEREAPMRLNCSVFDFLDETAIHDALAKLEKDAAPRRKVAIRGNSGAVYAGHIRQFDDKAGYSLMLEPLGPDASRPLVYDFDLFDKHQSSDLDNTSLRDLTFVVFDSETTGLSPIKDEVVQLAGVRIVNGKIILAECYDSLVNPGIPIPPHSTKVHHITDAMVADAPAFAQARAAFHAFAKDAVLVAHNAPFDMAFLHRPATETGLLFENPILDTVHLSAIVFGGSAEHTLDALCDRLDVHIRQDLRHTALGDAMATAEAFVALLPILEGRGLHTFGQIKAEMQKHARILTVQE